MGAVVGAGVSDVVQNGPLGARSACLGAAAYAEYGERREASWATLRTLPTPGVGPFVRRRCRKQHHRVGNDWGAPMAQSPRDTPSGQTEGPGRRLGAGAIGSLTGAGLLLVFVVQNTEDVSLDFLVWTFTWPLWLLTIVSAVLGALVWFGLGVIRRHRRREERRDRRRD
jgi:uncharacterized integral membrane protein